MPFKIVYGRAAPNLLTYVLGTSKVDVVDQTLQARDQVIQEQDANFNKHKYA